MMGIIKKLLGIDQIEQDIHFARAALEEAQAKKATAEAGAKLAREQEELARLEPKERATRKKEPWVGVLDTKINPDNPRNGFFELDWNEYFVLQLKQAGYGFDADPEEEIVDRWFRDLCRDVASEEGVDMTDRGSGFINVKKISEGKSEIS